MKYINLYLFHLFFLTNILLAGDFPKDFINIANKSTKGYAVITEDEFNKLSTINVIYLDVEWKFLFGVKSPKNKFWQVVIHKITNTERDEIDFNDFPVESRGKKHINLSGIMEDFILENGSWRHVLNSDPDGQRIDGKTSVRKYMAVKGDELYDDWNK